VDRIFISYRRDDSGGYAGSLYDDLQRAFRDRVYQDVHGSPAADRYRERIAAVLAHCAVVVVVIGPDWLRRDADGRNRLDDPGDLLRFEIVTALRRPDVVIFPVLLGGAALPRPADLPEEVRPLLERTALRIDQGPQRNAQTEVLIDAIGRRLDTRFAVPAALAAVLSVAAVALPMRGLSLSLKHAWIAPANDAAPAALLRLGALHAVEWLVMAACAAGVATLMARGARGALRALARGALLGTLAGLAGGALEQWLRAHDQLDAGALAGATLSATIAGFAGLAGQRSAASVAAAGVGALAGSLLVWGHRGPGPFMAQVMGAIVAVAALRLAGADLSRLAVRRRPSPEPPARAYR
jgi:hypothetical protein